MNTQLFINSLLLMGQGMLAIFLVIFIIYLVILLLGKIPDKSQRNK